MKRAVRLAAVLVPTTLAAALWVRPPNVPGGRSPARPGEPTSLAESLEPLRREFNRSRAERRLLAVFSPSCPVCLEGALALHRTVAAAGGDRRVFVVWSEVLPIDAHGRTGHRLELFSDLAGVLQFRDPHGRVPAVAAPAGWPDGEPLWDAVLLYPPGEVWRAELPRPLSWIHQRHGLETGHYRTGSAYVAALGEMLPPPV